MANTETHASTSGVRPPPPGQDSDPNLSRSSEKQMKYSAVPRRPSSKEIYEPVNNSKCGTEEEMMAPLGFEPEGSATKPSYSEGYSSLQGLLSDRSGYEVFRGYLRLQKHESLLDFWRSCEEFRRLANARSNLATSKANTTFNNFMHTKDLCGDILQDSIRAKVKHKLNSGQPPSESTFDGAQEAIFSYMNDFHYAKFTRSDVYKLWVGESGKNANKDRVSTRNNRFVGSALPSLPEEKVLAFEREANHRQWTSYDTAARSHNRQVDGEKEGFLLQKLSKGVIANMFGQPAPPVVSVNDSDVQSLSSDALTDDSKSTVTDFSDVTTRSSERKGNGQGLQNVPGFVPRTKNLPKARNQLPPEEFAKILIEKLEKVLLEREQEERATVNLAGVHREHIRENRKENKREKTILEDAAHRHYQYQQAGGWLGLRPCYPMQGSSGIIPSSSHSGYIEPCPMPSRYYPNTEPTDSASATWHGGCMQETMLEKAQCVTLSNTKKQWESVVTIESAPDSGVSIEEDHSLPCERRNRIFQWMEQGEKEACPPPQQSAYTKNTRTKHSGAYNKSHSGMVEQGVTQLRPIVQDPRMPPLPQPDSRNTIEEVSRRLSREKRSKSHHKRPGYSSSKSSQMASHQFSSDSADCSSSVMTGDHIPPTTMYSSSSVLSSVPSTVNSTDSGLGPVQKKTKIKYYFAGETYPYQSSLPGKVILLSQFKELINFKKGNYRYFFKKEASEEDCGAVFEEIMDDNAVLPCFGGKIICKVQEA